MANLLAAPRTSRETPSSPIIPFANLSRLLLSTLLFAIIHGAISDQQVISSPRDSCITQDAPNQHSQQYPDLATGILNGTTLIVPISLQTARQIIPAEYGIIEDAYRALLPSFPDGMYPMMAQIVHDHDIKLASMNASLPDFSRASLEFPFIDVLGDGVTSFRWANTFMMSASNPLAIQGAEGYGISVYPSTFHPSCNAYEASSLLDGATFAHSQSTNSTMDTFMTIETSPSRDMVPYPLDFIANVTNQPVFGNPSQCDYYMRLFNSTMASGAVPVVGKVRTNLEPLIQPQIWDGVFGWQVATPFLEPTAPEPCRAT
ncbi:hypothetical protein M426DRAFT_63457 [Hypoxylon sp. CI-4A]|nr:hypothetical protein M426DRAFT_63457 [Hypoxylon sp. CI-4A]